MPLLYRDDPIVVINEPSGLLVHRSPIDRHERRFAVQILRDQLGRRVYPVHRLDKGTSGALVFALDREMARDLAMRFASREVVKTYVAVVRGWPDVEGEINHPLPAVIDGILPDAGISYAATSRMRRTRSWVIRHTVRVGTTACSPSASARSACCSLARGSPSRTGVPLVIEAPLADEFAALLTALGWAIPPAIS